MMSLQLNAQGECKVRDEPRFAPPWLIASFVVVAVLLSIFFFPKEEISRQIEIQKKADRTAREYINNLIQLYPNNNSLKLIRADQDIKLGEIARAIKAVAPFLVAKPTTEDDWKALWLYYQIVRIETYAIPEVSPTRRLGYDKMRAILDQLSTHVATSSQLMVLADDAIALGEPNKALMLYKKTVDLALDEDSGLYAKAAKFALSQGDYNLSASMYFIAENKALTLDEKRDYFVLGLKSLQSGNLLDEAMIAAEKHVNDLGADKATLVFLTRLALAANKPVLAEKYVKKAITSESK